MVEPLPEAHFRTLQAKNRIREERNIAADRGTWIPDRDTSDVKEFDECHVRGIAWPFASLVVREVGHVTPVLSDNHDRGIEIALPQGPRANVIRVPTAALDIGSVGFVNPEQRWHAFLAVTS
jgi:hypothetical protein